MQTRPVVCRSSDNQHVDDGKCVMMTKPATVAYCPATQPCSNPL